MRSKRASPRTYESGSDQSRGPAATALDAVRDAFAVTLRWRFGRMEGRSVRSVWVEKRAEAARPTRPVPAPSSRVRGCGLGGGMG